MRVFLIRHGESIGNAQRIHQGQKKDFSLSELGKTQAELLKKRFQNIKIDAIYSSDLNRAKETAKIIRSEHHSKHDIILDKRLRERDFGSIDTEKNDIMKSWNNYLIQVKAKGIHPRDARPEGGESDSDHWNRVNSFFDDLKKRHKTEDTILVVAHGGTNKVALGVIGYLPIDKMYKTPQGNSCVNEFAFDGNRWKVKSINCMKHLEINKEIIECFEKIRNVA